MSNSSTSASIVLLHDTLCVSMCSLSLFFYPSFPPSLPPLSLSPLSLSSPGAMIKVAGMSLCSTAVITEERRASERGREEEGGEGRRGERKGSGALGQPDSSSATLPPSGVEVHDDVITSALRTR